MSILVTVWSIRLTYNFARRGGYSWKFWDGEEDYRWDILRQKPGFNNEQLYLRHLCLVANHYSNLVNDYFSFNHPRY